MSKRVWLSVALVALLVAQVAAVEKVVVTKGDPRAWMGVYVQKLDRERREVLGVKERKGVVIESVVADSPAEKAGLQEDDVIVKIDGKQVEDPDDLIAAVKAKKPGDKVKVEYVREGKSGQVEVVLARAPRVTERIVIPPLPRLERHVRAEEAWLGVQLQELNPSLAEYFGVKEDEGVLITEVEEKSPAQKAGLLPGDVIFSLDGQQVRDIEEVADILSDKEKGDSVVVAYVRKGARAETTVRLGKRSRVRVFERSGPGFWWWEGKPRREFFFHFPEVPELRFEFETPDFDNWRERARLWSERAVDDFQRNLERFRIMLKQRQSRMI